MIRLLVKNLSVCLAPPRTLIRQCGSPFCPAVLRNVRYRMSTVQGHPIQECGKQGNRLEDDTPSEKAKTNKILQLYPEGYGYYDWNNEESYVKAIQDQYFLNDLLVGFRKIIAKHKQYNEHHLAFMAYTMAMFRDFQPEILPRFLPGFIRLEEEAESHKKYYQHVSLIKIMCYDPRSKENMRREGLSAIVTPYLMRRVLHPENRTSLESIHRSISTNCYEHMGGLQEIFEDLKELLYRQCLETNYKISPKTTKLVMSIYQKLMIFDPHLKNVQFFSTLPPTFETNPQCLINMINMLTDIVSFNLVVFVSEPDLLTLNNRISKLKFRSDDVKDALRYYSEHLVLIGKMELINFQNLLDCI